jgi:hypothetical protein
VIPRIGYTVYNSAKFFAVRKPELQGQTVEVKQPISQVYYSSISFKMIFFIIKGLKQVFRKKKSLFFACVAIFFEDVSSI